MKIIIDIPEVPKNDKQRWVLTNGTPYIERPHGEWIPCSERLPEEIGDYLVTDYHGNVYCSSFDYILREKCFNYEDDGYTVEDDTVVAWMPLPEPYKKEGEAE